MKTSKVNFYDQLWPQMTFDYQSILILFYKKSNLKILGFITNSFQRNQCNLPCIITSKKSTYLSSCKMDEPLRVTVCWLLLLHSNCCLRERSSSVECRTWMQKCACPLTTFMPSSSKIMLRGNSLYTNNDLLTVSEV